MVTKKTVTIGIRIDEQTANYIQTLANIFDLPRVYVIRQLLRAAIRLHKEGVLKFPELTINKEQLKKFLEEQKIFSVGTTNS